MKDFLGHRLLIGDEVVALKYNETSAELHYGRVLGFTKNYVRLQCLLPNGKVDFSFRDGKRLISGCKTVKVKDRNQEG